MNEIKIDKNTSRIMGCVLVLFGGRIERDCDGCDDEHCQMGDAKAVTEERCAPYRCSQCGRAA